MPLEKQLGAKWENDARIMSIRWPPNLLLGVCAPPNGLVKVCLHNGGHWALTLQLPERRNGMRRLESEN